MLALQLSRIQKSYGVQVILEDISFIVNAGERVGLIGPNGCGKTTLLGIIAGDEQPDRGVVNVRVSVGYLAQGIALDETRTIGDYIRAGIPGYDDARREVESLVAKMAQNTSQAIIDAYGAAFARFESLGGYAIDHRAVEILAGLGLDAPQDTSITMLSGGQRARVGLARLLIAEPELLLLDEPTNHLDIAALEWLERFIDNYRGAAIIVSQDWAFLDATVSRILELDDATHRIREYAGNYTDYVEAKSLAREKQFAAWQDQQDEITQLQMAARHLRGIAKFRKGGKADSGDKFAKGFFANRGRETVLRAKQIERRIEHLLTDERIAKPQPSWQMKLDFGTMPHGGQIVVALEDLGFAFPGDREGRPYVFRHTNLILRHGERIALVGPNGSGKTTLLRLIVGELKSSEGIVRIGSNVKIGYMPQDQETLDANTTPLTLIRAIAPMTETDARNFLHFFLFAGDAVFTPVGLLS